VPRTPSIGKVKETIKESVSSTQGTVGLAVGKARETLESLSDRVPVRRPAARRKKPAAPAPEPLERQDAPRKTHGDALLDDQQGAPSGPAAQRPARQSGAGGKAPTKKAAKPAATKKAPAKKTAAKKTAAKKAPAKKTAVKKTAAKKTPAPQTPAKTAKKTAAKKTAAKKSAPRKTSG